jgi:hypothetical protein
MATPCVAADKLARRPSLLVQGRPPQPWSAWALLVGHCCGSCPSGAFSVAPSAPPFFLSAFFLAGSFASSLPVAPVAPDGSESWAWFSSAAPVQTGFAGVRSEGSDGPALNDAVPRGI